MKWLSYVVSVLIAQAAGGIGAVATSSSIPTWYASIAKPSWNPPNWIFGPVWTLLFTLMGIAAGLVWLKRSSSPIARDALIVYGIQLALNVAWSFLFFGMQSPGTAFSEILLLIIAISVTTVLFWRVSHAAAWLMVPYLAWVVFASALNFTIWRLNS
jgi:tryptophan-rich sensory protein